jgi:hypothetical protein
MAAGAEIAVTQTARRPGRAAPPRIGRLRRCLATRTRCPHHRVKSGHDAVRTPDALGSPRKEQLAAIMATVPPATSGGGSVRPTACDIGRICGRRPVSCRRQRSRVGKQLERRTVAARQPARHERPARACRIKQGWQHSGVVPLCGTPVADVRYRDDPVPGPTQASPDTGIAVHNGYISARRSATPPRCRRIG